MSALPPGAFVSGPHRSPTCRQHNAVPHGGAVVVSGTPGGPDLPDAGPVVLLVHRPLLGLTRAWYSYDEIARTSQSAGPLNTLPLELQAMQTNATTSVIYALGTFTTALSLAVILVCLLIVMLVHRRRTQPGVAPAPEWLE